MAGAGRLTGAPRQDQCAQRRRVRIRLTAPTNGLNQYTVVGPATFAYDANGNLTADGADSWLYDVENRLVAASGGHDATLRYDPLGRLYEVAPSTGAATRFLYEGNALVAEYDASGNMLRRYVHGADAGTDDPQVWYEGAGLSQPRFLHPDHQGSIVAIADASGAIASINAYDEYGIPNRDSAGNVTNSGRFQYTGQAWLEELGMYHYKARIYSPTLGRFLQTDPVGYEDQVNLYAYVANDPVNAVDPDGQESACFSPGGSGCNYNNPAGWNFIRGMLSYPRDLYAEARHAVWLSGLVGREAQNRALLVDAMANRAVRWASANPGESVRMMADYVNNNRAFFAGRATFGALVGSRAGPAGGGALFLAGATGGAVRALNNVVSALESNGIGTQALGDRAVASIYGAGALGANVRFNARTGDVTATLSFTRPGSRIRETQTTTICNVRSNCD